MVYIKKSEREKLQYYSRFKCDCTKNRLLVFLKQAYMYRHFFVKISKGIYKCTDGLIIQTEREYKIGELIYHPKNKMYYRLERRNVNPKDYRFQNRLVPVIYLTTIEDKIVKWSFVYSRFLDKEKTEYTYYVSDSPFYCEILEQKNYWYKPVINMSNGFGANQSGYTYTREKGWRIPTPKCDFNQRGLVLVDQSFIDLNLRSGFEFIEPCKTDELEITWYLNCTNCENSDFEKLAKMGLIHLYDFKDSFNWDGKSFKQITGLDKTYLEVMQHPDYSKQLHKLILEFNIPEDMALKLVNTVKISHYYLINFYSDFKEFILDNRLTLKLLSYFIDSKVDINLYKDYFGWLKDLGYPLTKENLFPKNIKVKHDELQKIYTEKKEEILKEKIQKQFERLKKYTYQNNKYVIEPFETQTELIEESKQLNHCIRTYAKKYANNETELYKIRLLSDIKQSFYSLEFKNGEIIQCRGNHNKIASKEVINFYTQWFKEIRNKGEKGNGTN